MEDMLIVHLYRLFQDHVVEIATFAGFLIILKRCSRRFFIHLFGVIIAIEGLYHVTFSKRYSISTTQGEAAVGHVELKLRGIGFLQLFKSGQIWLLSKSSDPTIEVSQLLDYIVLGFCITLARGHALLYPPENLVSAIAQSQERLFFGAVLFTFGSVFYVLRSKGMAWAFRGNFYMLLNSVFEIILGLAMYVWPYWALENGESDGADLFNTRWTGASFLSMSAMSFCSTSFRDATDRDCVMITRFMIYPLFTVMCWFNPIFGWSRLSWIQIVGQVLCGLILEATAYGAINRDLDVFKRILWSRITQLPQDLKTLIKRKSS